jgi:hypothetical protein
MNNFRSFFVVLLSISLTVFVFSCKEEEPLEPNEAAALLQTPNYDGSEFYGDGGVNGGNGGNNGGGSNVDQYFEATVNGSSLSFSSFTYSYQESFGITMMSGANNSTVTSISFNLSDSLNVGDTVDLSSGGASYIKGVGNAWSSFDGKLFVDDNTSSFIEGVFYFDAENLSTSDTVSVTSGSFKLAK